MPVLSWVVDDVARIQNGLKQHQHITNLRSRYNPHCYKYLKATYFLQLRELDIVRIEGINITCTDKLMWILSFSKVTIPGL
jgi:hypothetical protein